MATALHKTKTVDFKNMALQCQQLKDNAGLAVDLTELTALTGAELGFIDGVTAGTALASKALVLGASKEIATITTLTATTLNSTDLDAGASGTAGSADVFPATASKGKLAITATDNSGDTTTALVAGAQAGARTYTLQDAGGSADVAYTDYQVSLIAHTDGGAASTIGADVQSVVMASVNAAATDWILLPAGVAGRRIRGWSVVAHEIRTPASSTATINTVDSDGTSNELAIPATTLWEAFCVATDTWVVTAQDELGADIAALVPDAV